MATHSSVLAWRIPGMAGPGGLRLWGRTELDTTEATQQQQQHEVPTQPSFITFPTCLKCSMTVQWSMLIFLATSGVVVRGSALMTCTQLVTINFCSSSSRLLSPLQNFLNYHSTVCSLAVTGPNALLILRAVSTAL